VLGETVPVRRIVRQMKGCGQNRLVEGQDGSQYILRCSNNPQGARTLINEVLATHALRRLNVTVPDLKILSLSENVLKEAGSPTFAFGNRKIPLSPGRHLGSKCPVDLHSKAVYDLIPVRLVKKVANIAHFARTFILDHAYWNTDRRQMIFVRSKNVRLGIFDAYMIDQGHFFGGPEWNLYETTHYSRPLYFDQVFTPTLLTENKDVIDFALNFASSDWGEILKRIPSEWMGSGDAEALRDLQRQLIRRLPRRVEHLEREWKLLAKTAPSSLLRGEVCSRINAADVLLACTIP
jgi:hypothetical protein